jgi:hypothetical protein
MAVVVETLWLHVEALGEAKSAVSVERLKAGTDTLAAAVASAQQPLAR